MQELVDRNKLQWFLLNLAAPPLFPSHTQWLRNNTCWKYLCLTMVSGKLHPKKGAFSLFSQCNSDPKTKGFHFFMCKNQMVNGFSAICRHDKALYGFKLFQSPIAMPSMVPGDHIAVAMVGHGLLWELPNNIYIYESNIYTITWTIMNKHIIQVDFIQCHPKTRMILHHCHRTFCCVRVSIRSTMYLYQLYR